jgi:uncharacterized protein (DUF1800 family)
MATAGAVAATLPLAPVLSSETPIAEPDALELAQASTPSLPPLEVLVMTRLAYGHRPDELETFRNLGATPQARLTAWAEQQLNPTTEDPPFDAKLRDVRMRIRYENTDGMGNKVTVDENRPLGFLNTPQAELWQLSQNDAMYDAERDRPYWEVVAATWLRAVYSRWQLREVLVEFWHNHFNVNAYTNNEVMTTWPAYDRIIRQHCFGNFRAFVEDVAKSPAMMYYLNNASNRVAGPNENYARELFELHTLGSDNYLNTLYNRWRLVPGAEQGRPSGYIDEDVYEAARAFTGWKIADGTGFSGGRLPNTGEFLTVDQWADRFQKRVLATEFAPNQSSLNDGRKVIELVANHPGTARHLCTKLCRRLVADDPPASLIDRAVQAWTSASDAPDQIKQTLRAIILAPEFATIYGRKAKRPFELFASFIRGSGMEFPPRNLFDTYLTNPWYMDSTGYRLFTWPAPTGHPEEMGFWLSTNSMLRCWTILNDMVNWKGFWGVPDSEARPFNARALTPTDRTTSRQIVEFWVQRMLGRPLNSTSLDSLINFLRRDAGPDTAPRGSEDELTRRINGLVALIAMTPQFRWR